jgi:hypothetical protein
MMNRPKYIRSLLIGTLGVLAFALLTLGQAALERTAVAAGQESIQAPIFEVDPLWPKPLPNSWVQGMTIGLAVDFQDNVWIVHRNNMLAVNEIPADGDSPITQGECCFAAPPVLAFNQAGDLIQHWGGPGEGYEWPQSNHGLAFDHKDNIWIGGNGADDAHVLKFTKERTILNAVWGTLVGMPEATTVRILVASQRSLLMLKLMRPTSQMVMVIGALRSLMRIVGNLNVTGGRTVIDLMMARFLVIILTTHRLSNSEVQFTVPNYPMIAYCMSVTVQAIAFKSSTQMALL